jgi:3-phenylpropionate/cinnamic acid dioxygenase small subunit
MEWSDLNNPHETLVAKNEIAEVITLLFVRTDQRDWQAVRACFTEQVRFDMTSLAGGEPVTVSAEEIVTAWERGLQPIQQIHHQIGNLLIRVGDGEADAFCYGTASHYLPNPSNETTRVFVGSYDFHLVQQRGTWLIDLFRFNLKYLDGNLDLEKSAT